MRAQTPPDPPGAPLFSRLYTLLAWAGLLLFVGIVAWLIWVLLANTAPGASRRLTRAELQPTVAALAATESYGSEIVGSVPASRAPLPAVCAACHRVAGTDASGTVGPELTQVGAIASRRIAADDYDGSATTAAAYIRESILAPDAYVVPGSTHTTESGASTMPAAVGQSLSPAELDALVRELAARQ